MAELAFGIAVEVEGEWRSPEASRSLLPFHHCIDPGRGERRGAALRNQLGQGFIEFHGGIVSKAAKPTTKWRVRENNFFFETLKGPAYLT